MYIIIIIIIFITSVHLPLKQLIFVHTLKEVLPGKVTTSTYFCTSLTQTADLHPHTQRVVFSGKVTTSAYLRKSLTPSAGFCTHTQTQRVFFLAKSQPLLTSVRLSLKQLIFVHTLKVFFSWQSHNTYLLLYVSQLVFMHTLKELGFFLAKSQPLLTSIYLPLIQLVFVHTLKLKEALPGKVYCFLFSQYFRPN